MPGALVLLPLFSVAGQAQIASLVSDLNPELAPVGSQFGPLLQLRGRLLFAGSEATLGKEFWATDGTAAGTRLLADSCPGDCGIDRFSSQHGVHLAYWAAPTPAGCWRIWRSDGTRQGTFPVSPEELRSVKPGAVISDDRLIFGAGTVDFDLEPWVSDGTPEGTISLRDDVSGAALSLWGAISSLGSSALFFARDRPDGSALWRTDGTAEGTSVVADFGALSPLPGVDAVAAGKLFFGLPAAAGPELWTSDGTSAGTRTVKTFTEPGSLLYASSPVALGEHIVFPVYNHQAGQELWVSDGTRPGTYRLSQLAHSSPFPPTGSPLAVAEISGRFLFLAEGDTEEARALWASEGNPAHTQKLADVCGRRCDSLPAWYRLETLGPRAYFAGQDAVHGHEVWATDGTPAGTDLLFDACPGACGEVHDLAVVGDQLYFVAFDLDHGYQLWRSDGTLAGTRRLTRFENDPPGEPGVSLLGRNGLFQGEFYFAATDPVHGTQLWKRTLDGSLSTLTRFSSSGAGSHPGPVLELGGRAVFHACAMSDARALWSTLGSPVTTVRLTEDGSFDDCSSLFYIVLGRAGELAYFVPVTANQPSVLWRTDGTPAGTRELLPLSADYSQRDSIQFVELGGRAYFSQALDDRFELWRSDGTAAGTVAEVAVSSPSLSDLWGLSALGEEMFFFTRPFHGPWEAWRSDGTEAGTIRLVQLGDSSTILEPEFTRAGDQAFFRGPSTGAGFELWRTDGTPEGTAMVKDILPGFDSARPGSLAALGDRLCFFATSPETELGLWITDGSEAGTTLLHGFEAVSGGAFARPARPVELRGRLLFAADDGEHGLELWETDGTSGGTRLLKDFVPGRSPSQATSLIRAADRVFFSANDGIHGEELWVTDGTVQGTRLVYDLAPGPVSSSPRNLSVAGGRLYFAADDGLFGRELWSLDVAAPAGTCAGSPSALCLQGERFRVEIAWRDFQGRSGMGTPVEITSDTGFFWFFNPANVETLVKVLDGRSLNDHFWTFYGALSNVEYTMTVTDAQSGLTRRYFNPLGTFASVGDTEAFGPHGASLESFTALRGLVYQSAEPEIASALTREGAGTCGPSSTRLCLNGGRFAVEATWRDFQDRTGTGLAVPLTQDTGYFWFFRDTNVEVVVKALDGRPVNGHFWLFYGALSNVEYTLTVTDTERGAVRTYFNPGGRFASIGDTTAFPGD